MTARVIAIFNPENTAGNAWGRRIMKKNRIPVMPIDRPSMTFSRSIDSNPVTRESINLDPWPICLKPDNIVLVVAGGAHPTHSYWLQAHSPSVVGRPVRLPETFDRLLTDAQRDLGA